MGDRVKKLEEKLKSPNTKILQLSSQANTPDASSRQNECNDKPATVQVESIARRLPPRPPPSIIDRKYNVVFYGIKESPADTSKSDRVKHDLEGTLTKLSDIDTTLTSALIKDYYRLGKYKQTSTHPHPILVKFLRVFEASLMLSNKGSSVISIKPDITWMEWETEQLLLKERQHLIDSGIEHRFIRISGNSLYVNRWLSTKLSVSSSCI